MASIIPQGGRLLGNIIPDLVISESTIDSWEVTAHPVQQGASISDHKYRKPISLKLSMMFKAGSTSDLSTTYKKLLDLQASTALFDVMTPKRIYNNMQLISLSSTTDQHTENVLSISGELREVIIVSVVVTNVPPRSKHKNAKKTGGTAKSGSKTAKDIPTKKPIDPNISIAKEIKTIGTDFFTGKWTL
jgi:hypothetical protein